MTRVCGRAASRVCRRYFLGPEHPMKLRLWRWLRGSLGYPRLTVPYGRGGWITVDERDWLQRQILVGGEYEPEVWEALSAFATAGEIVWDVGAHIGAFSVLALLDPRVGEAHAFEPDPAQAEVLTLNLALNGGRSTVHRFALGARRERRPLYRGPEGNTGMSSLRNGSGRGACQVECVTADDVAFGSEAPPPTLLKIDVEGWELEVLRGAERLLRERPPKAIVLEAEADPSGRMREPGVADCLEARGYGVRWIRRPSGEIEPRENYLAWRL